MTLRSAKARLSGLLTSIQERVLVLQDKYLPEHARYWQGLQLLDEVPNFNEPRGQDTRRKPTDQAEDWSILGFHFGATVPGTFRVDIYETPSGEWGHAATASVRDGDVTWTKSLAVGPESGRWPSGWTAVVEDPDIDEDMQVT